MGLGTEVGERVIAARNLRGLVRKGSVAGLMVVMKCKGSVLSVRRVITRRVQCVHRKEVLGWKNWLLIGYFAAVGIGVEKTCEPIEKRVAVVG